VRPIGRLSGLGSESDQPPAAILLHYEPAPLARTRLTRTSICRRRRRLL